MRVCAKCDNYRGYRYGTCQAFRIIPQMDCPDWTAKTTPRPAPWWRRIWRKEGRQ